MTDFWLISVPGNPEPKESWDEISEKTSHLSSTTKFAIPDLKVGIYCTMYKAHTGWTVACMPLS